MIINEVVALLIKKWDILNLGSLCFQYRRHFWDFISLLWCCSDNPRKEKFIESLESIQLNATAAITTAIKGTCKNIKQWAWHRISQRSVIDAKTVSFSWDYN